MKVAQYSSPTLKKKRKTQFNQSLVHSLIRSIHD